MRPVGIGPRVQLFGSGAILRSVLDAQKLLGRRVCRIERRLERDQLHAIATGSPRVSTLEYVCIPMRSHGFPTWSRSWTGPPVPSLPHPIMSAAVAEQISPWVPGGLFVLGTDGMGRSETRPTLRRHFEVDAEFVTLAVLHRLHEQGQ